MDGLSVVYTLCCILLQSGMEHARKPPLAGESELQDGGWEAWGTAPCVGE